MPRRGGQHQLRHERLRPGARRPRRGEQRRARVIAAAAEQGLRQGQLQVSRRDQAPEGPVGGAHRPARGAQVPLPRPVRSRGGGRGGVRHGGCPTEGIRRGYQL